MKHSFHIYCAKCALLPLLAILVSSCDSMFTRPYNPKGNLGKKGKILVESILEAHQDTLRIRSGVTTALANGHTVDAQLLDMSIQVNGKEVEVFEDKKSPKEFINQKNFFVLCKLQEEDIIQLQADAPEVEPVRAKVSVGPALPKISISKSLEWTDKNSYGYEDNELPKRQCLKFTITVDEKPATGQYYAVQVLRRLELIGHDDDVHIGAHSDFNRTELDDLYTLESSDFMMSGRHYDLCGRYHDGDMQVFDSYYTNEEGKMCFEVFVANRRKEWISDQLYAQPRYKIVVSRISREIYRRIEKQNRVEGIWELGMGPHAYEFSNIDGGVGMLGTKLDYVSEWIINE